MLYGKQIYNKINSNATEEATRRAIWTQNVNEINNFNQLKGSKNSTFWLGLNQMSDLTHDEFKSMLQQALTNQIASYDSKYSFDNEEALIQGVDQFGTIAVRTDVASDPLFSKYCQSRILCI